MKIIGITGKSGSGKSTLATMLSEQEKCDCINIDKIGHQATKNEEISKKLCDVFGNKILGNDKKIERKKLGNIVFSNKEKMDILTNITWGYMQEVLDEILRKNAKTIILEWALLPISKYWEMCDVKVLMQAEEKARKNKVIQRDHISEEYFLKRDAGSIDYQLFEYDLIFHNDYEIETAKKMTKKIVTF